MPELTLTGTNFIAGSPSATGAELIRAVAAATGATIEPDFHVATASEIASAGAAAGFAAPPYAALPAEKRADFLEAISVEIQALGDGLLERAHIESALPIARLTGERGRTCQQLEMFAKLIREGSWVDARIDPAMPERAPLPRADLRRMLVPLGPVAVFGASNFPLAFSVAGGDTASALAAGCPVIVKAHPAHPGTSELVGSAIVRAAANTGMPPGVFSLLHGDASAGRAIVALPELSAVGFTGSLAAGRALYDLAASRPKPIPVFAEMGSVNPLFVLPGALAARTEEFAKGYSGSLTLGVGQFCTNPGLLLGIRGASFSVAVDAVALALSAATPAAMLTPGICERYTAGVAHRKSLPSLEAVFVGEGTDGRAAPALFRTTAKEFLAEPELVEELFGPAAIVIEADDEDELVQTAKALPGQLTASLHFAESDKGFAANLLSVLAARVGRVVANGFPTGVEVGAAMQHGGPYPATTDSRSTSVGTAAILRFVRPVAFQDVPDEMLPPELQQSNPRGIWRLVNGKLSQE